MDTKGLPSSSPSSQAPYQRVPSLSSAPIMDHDQSNTNNLPPAGEFAHTNSNNGMTGGYVYPSGHQLQFNHPASSSNPPPNSYHNPFYPDSHLQQQHQDDNDHNNQLSSSSPLRLDNDNNINSHNSNYPNNQDDDAESIAPVYLSTITPPGKILLLQTLTTLSTIVFTVLPVVIKAGPDATWGNWYTWRDAVRLIEPFVSGLFHSWFFYSSDLMRRWNRGPIGYDDGRNNYRASTLARSSSWGDVALDNKQGGGGGRSGGNISLDDRNQQQQQQQSQQHYSPVLSRKSSSWKHTPTFRAFLANVFTFFLIVYVTGAAIHTAAAFFKNIIVLFLEQYSQGIGLSTHAPTTGNGQLSLALATQLKEGYLLIQDTWEHNVSHYMYALGALGMSWCEMVAYSGQVLPVGVNLARVGQVSTNGSQLGVRSRKSSKHLVLLWILAGVLYGGIVAGVACQYPKGLYVGLIYVAALSLILVTYILSRPTRGLFTLGRHYILQTYLIGMVVAAVAIVIYLATHHFEFLTSNDKSHLASTTRP